MRKKCCKSGSRKVEITATQNCTQAFTFFSFFLDLFILAYFEWTPFHFFRDLPQMDIKSHLVFQVTQVHNVSTKVFSLLAL